MTDLQTSEAPLALVTGGSRGIGRAIARRLKARGMRVGIVGRSQDALDAVIAAGDADHRVVADVADPQAVEAALTTVRQWGDLDVLVTNAGAASTAPFSRTDVAAMRDMFDVNVLGATSFIAGLAPAMVTRGRGRIVAIASMAGLKGYAYVSAYVAAKHALVGYVRAVATELATTGVTINAVCPGFTDTDLVESSVETIMRKTGRSREAALAELTKHNPQGRLVSADEVAAAVLWLCEPHSGAINGQAIAVAGGEVS